MPVKLLACAAILAGCAHHRPLSAAPEIEDGRWVTIQTTSGTVSALKVPTRTGMGYQDQSGRMIDSSAIVSITDNRGWRGAGEGLLIVGGLGVAVGVGLGLADGDDPPCGDDSWCLLHYTAGEKAQIAGFLLGSTGALLGLVIGALHGSDEIYSDGESMTISPNGPPGSVAGATITF